MSPPLASVKGSFSLSPSSLSSSPSEAPGPAPAFPAAAPERSRGDASGLTIASAASGPTAPHLGGASGPPSLSSAPVAPGPTPPSSAPGRDDRVALLADLSSFPAPGPASAQYLAHWLAQAAPAPARPNLSAPASWSVPGPPAGPSPLASRRETWAALLGAYPVPAVARGCLNVLAHGAAIGYEGPLRAYPRQHVANLPMDAVDADLVRASIAPRMVAGQLQATSTAQHVSPIGMVPKGDGGRRMIHHLSHPRGGESVNAGIPDAAAAISYTSLSGLLDFVAQHPGCLVWKSDLRDAFRHVAVAAADAPLIGFTFEGVVYRDTVLTFGGRSSPQIFNRFAELLHWALATLMGPSHFVDHYLDDFFGASDDPTSSTQALQVFFWLCTALGFSVHLGKSVAPSTTVEVLSLVVDTVALRVSLSPARRTKLLARCEELLRAGSATLLELQQLLGHLHFATRTAAHSRAFLRRLWDALRAYRASFRRRLPRAALEELRWWSRLLATWDGDSLLQPSPLIVHHVWTDACPRGWGAHLGVPASCQTAVAAEWPRRHRSKPIHFLETLTVLEALRAFTKPDWSGHTVVVHIDNEVARHALTTGAVRCPSTQAVVRATFSWAIQHHLSLVFVRVSSAQNVLADLLSRSCFAQIASQFPHVLPVLVTSQHRLSRSLQRSASRRPPPTSSGTASLPQRAPATARLMPRSVALPPKPVSGLPGLPAPPSWSSGPPTSPRTARPRPSSLSSPASPAGTPIWASTPRLSPPRNSNGVCAASSASRATQRPHRASPLPCLSWPPSCGRSTTTLLSPPGIDKCSSPPGCSPSRASSGAAKSLGTSSVPTPPSLLDASSSLPTTPSWYCRPARPTPSGEAPTLSSHACLPPTPRSCAPGRRYTWSPMADQPTNPSSSCPGAPSLATNLSPHSAATSRRLALPPRPTLDTLSGGAPRPGPPPREPALRKSGPWAAGTLTAIDDMSIAQSPNTATQLRGCSPDTMALLSRKGPPGSSPRAPRALSPTERQPQLSLAGPPRKPTPPRDRLLDALACPGAL